ncbi:MAG: peptide ABC transporter substrate-binding protein [Candidatus Acidiferrales bacterium]
MHLVRGCVWASALLLISSTTLAAQVLRRDAVDEPEGLDPHKTDSTAAATVERDLYEGLVIFAPNGQITGGAAQSWDISADGLQYTFQLRPGLRWSNGEDLTADDFVYSFRRLVNPATKSPYAFMAFPIRNAREISGAKDSAVDHLGVAAEGPSRLKITLAQPTPYFLTALTHPSFAPVNRKAIEQQGASFGKTGTFVGNGAFTLEEWTPGARIVLKKNPSYWDHDHVKLAEVHYLAPQTDEEEARQFFAGATDITWSVPASQLAEIRAKHADELKSYPDLAVFFYPFDLKSGPFKSSVKLRQALAMVTDREYITREITGRGEKPAYSWIPPGIPEYTPQEFSWAKFPNAERLAVARQLYADAGYGPGKQLKVELRLGEGEYRQKMAQAVARQWKEALGVEAQVVASGSDAKAPEDPATGIVTARGWLADYADANSFAELWLSDSTENTSGYSNHQYDSLVSSANSERNPSERAKVLEEAERMLLSDYPMIPICDFVQLRLVRKTVAGYAPNANGVSYSKNIEIVDDRQQENRSPQPQ